MQRRPRPAAEEQAQPCTDPRFYRRCPALPQARALAARAAAQGLELPPAAALVASGERRIELICTDVVSPRAWA